MMNDVTSPCLCCSRLNYVDCCQPYHLGRALPSTPEALMRSRYSAYARGLVDYLMKTTHPEHPQYDNNTRRWRLGLAQYCRQATFESLKIIDVEDVSIIEAPEASETQGFVTFEARYTLDNAAYVLREKSEFRDSDGRWLYYAGDSTVLPA